MKQISGEPARRVAFETILWISGSRYGRPRVFSAVLSYRFIAHTRLAHSGETNGPIVETAGPNTLRAFDFGAITDDTCPEPMSMW